MFYVWGLDTKKPSGSQTVSALITLCGWNWIPSYCFLRLRLRRRLRRARPLVFTEVKAGEVFVVELYDTLVIVLSCYFLEYKRKESLLAVIV